MSRSRAGQPPRAGANMDSIGHAISGEPGSPDRAAAPLIGRGQTNVKAHSSWKALHSRCPKHPKAMSPLLLADQERAASSIGINLSTIDSQQTCSTTGVPLA